MNLRLGFWSLAVVWSLVMGQRSFAADVASPLSPGAAQSVFVLADSSLRIELAAAEPQVVDPVAIRFDEDGRMWVVEMRDYPLGNPSGKEPLSCIRVLDDRDGDGLFETATTFADKLLFVTGLQPWQGGVFVTLAGRLAYMKDTDGDGRADVDETWFEGFAEGNPQGRANHPRLAPDNWVYVADGRRGGQIINRKLGETEPVNFSGMNFRFNPVTGVTEVVSANAQFGLCFDDWGNRFNCSSRNPVLHVVIEDHYLKANPSVTVPATSHNVAAFADQSRIFPISRAWTTSNLHAGQFTAACGVYIYRGDLLPAEFKGNVFTCDSAGNLVHRQFMQPAGATFTAKPAYEGKEFLASPDEWFRPVNMELGPDGALYVVDMYRCVIEHPAFLPEELKRRPDLRDGDDRGRIWRILATDTSPQRTRGIDVPPLSKHTAQELVSLLDHPNAWQRETAQRLLFERGAASVVGQLRQLLASASSAEGKSHALWTLVGLQGMSSDDCRRAMQDRSGPLRRQAARAAEAASIVAELNSELRELCNDPHDAARFQARLTTSLLKTKHPLMLNTVLRDANDDWMRRSVLLSVTYEQAAELLHQSLRSHDRAQPSEGYLALVEELSAVAGRHDSKPDVMSDILPLFDNGQADVALAALRGASKNWNRSATETEALTEQLITKLNELARNTAAPLQNRSAAVALLAFAPHAAGRLVDFASPAEAQPLRLAAIGALARIPGNGHWNELLEGFPAETPPIRRAIIDALLANPDRTKLLLDAIEAGQVKPSEIDLTQVRRLTSHRDASVKERAEKLLAAAMPTDRAKALADYQHVLQMKGNARTGQAVFEKNCAACHRIAGIGSHVAPDISDSRTKKYDQLLTDIIQPNRGIDNNYLGYIVQQVDGTVLTGILTAETATSITLRQQGGKEAVISRSEIEELRSTGQSLMPEGLERQISPGEMADLLAFIKNWRYLDGKTPLSSQ